MWMRTPLKLLLLTISISIDISLIDDDENNNYTTDIDVNGVWNSYMIKLLNDGLFHHPATYVGASLIETDLSMKESFGDKARWSTRRTYEDPILETMGDVGVWQISIVVVLTLFNMPATLQLIAPEVEAMEGGFWCRRPPSLHNISTAEWIKLSGTTRPAELGGLEYNPCHIKKLNLSLSYEEMMKSRSADEITCTGWEYSQEWWTIIAQFNLACSKLPINTLAESVFSAGAACSCLIVGIAGDRHGRRVVLLVAQFVQMVTGIITGFSLSYTGYLVSTGIQGFVCNALMTCTSVLCVEVTGGRWKSTMSVFYMYSYGLGYFTLAGLAYFFRRWNHLHIVISLLSLLLFSFWWFLPESPRWLLTRNQLDGVMGVLEAAASINSKPLPSDVVVRMKKMEVLYISGQRTKVEMEMLFKTPIMKHLTVVTPFIFFFIFISYYGLTLRKVTIFSITDVMHVLMIKGGLEMIATSVALILSFCPGIMFLVVSTLVEGILCLASALWPSRSAVSMVLILTSRFFASVTNTSIAMTVASFYPTSIRMTGLGWGYTCVGLALFVATNVVNLGRIAENLPQVLFGTSACLGSILLLLLPKQLDQSYDLISQLENTQIKLEDTDISDMLKPSSTKKTLLLAEPTKSSTASAKKSTLTTTTSKSKVPFFRF